MLETEAEDGQAQADADAEEHAASTKVEGTPLPTLTPLEAEQSTTPRSRLVTLGVEYKAALKEYHEIQAKAKENATRRKELRETMDVERKAIKREQFEKLKLELGE